MDNENWRDQFNREWMGDFTSLTNEEIQILITNIFYQIFLIQLDNIKITTDSDEFGMKVRIVLEGEAYKDPINLSNEDIDYEEEEESEED